MIRIVLFLLLIALVAVGAAWIAGIGFWAAGLADQIGSDIYQARHHYRLETATVVAGIALLLLPLVLQIAHVRTTTKPVLD